MRPFSILFTNNTLSHRAGSELWVRDMCRALVGRGHRPIAFSLVAGAVAEELRAATVPVVTDLQNVASAPDLIHGHHHIETLIAALHFPGVPIVHFCHGWLPWEEEPLRHPSIVRYVAVDATCADRLTSEAGISPDRVDRLPNFVDLRRFAPRSPLPPRPRKALVLSNGAAHNGFAAVIREACQEKGIELEIAGLESGRIVEHPGELLLGFDLVFAKGRTALEALAVGCSVVLADVAGAGPLVTTYAFDWMRSCNFGIRLLQEPHSVDWYRSQISAYDASEAGLVSARVRQDAGVDVAVDRLLDIYRRAIAEQPSAGSSHDLTVSACIDAQRAAARHLCSVALRLKRTDSLACAVQGELGAARKLNEQLVNEREVLQQSLARADEALRLTRDGDRAQSAELARTRHALAEQERLVATFRALPSLRLRDALIRVPILGATARRAARWLARSSFPRARR